MRPSTTDVVSIRRKKGTPGRSSAGERNSVDQAGRERAASSNASRRATEPSAANETTATAFGAFVAAKQNETWRAKGAAGGRTSSAVAGSSADRDSSGEPGTARRFAAWVGSWSATGKQIGSFSSSGAVRTVVPSITVRRRSGAIFCALRKPPRAQTMRETASADPPSFPPTESPRRTVHETFETAAYRAEMTASTFVAGTASSAGLTSGAASCAAAASPRERNAPAAARRARAGAECVAWRTTAINSTARRRPCGGRRS